VYEARGDVVVRMKGEVVHSARWLEGVGCQVTHHGVFPGLDVVTDPRLRSGDAFLMDLSKPRGGLRIINLGEGDAEAEGS
jgi:hypothetical protein